MGYGQLIPLSVFEEAGLGVKKLQMTHFSISQSGHSVSIIVLLFYISLIKKKKKSMNTELIHLS